MGAKAAALAEAAAHLESRTPVGARSRSPIYVWQFEDAPEEWQRLSTNGGDEDWLAFVPDSFPDQSPTWLDHLVGYCCVDRYPVEGGHVYIGSHS